MDSFLRIGYYLSKGILCPKYIKKYWNRQRSMCFKYDMYLSKVNLKVFYVLKCNVLKNLRCKSTCILPGMGEES